MSDLAAQVLNAVITSAPQLDDVDMTRCALLLRGIRSHHWGTEEARRVAETVLAHLDARRAFGYATLRAQLPDLAAYLTALPKAGEIENIRVGAQALTDAGQRDDVLNAMREAAKQLKAGSPALNVASFLAGRLSEETAGGHGYRHVSEIQSVLSYYESLEANPNQVIRLHPYIDPMLRWNGLPVTDVDGETVLIVARSGHGKTALGIALALNAARQGYPVQYDVIADASAYQIRERMVHQIAGLPLKRDKPLSARLGPVGARPGETVRERLAWAEGVLNRLPIEINDHPDMDQHELRVRLAHKKAKGVRLSVIENLDHMSWDDKEARLERRFQLGELTKIVRQFDRQSGHHTFLLAQANRQATEGDGIPRGDHTADSDQPVRHVTIQLGLHNPNVDQPGGSLDLKARFGKNRQGHTGDFLLPADLVNPALAVPRE